MENNYKADGKSDMAADKTPEFDESETMFDLDICSATDCTGLSRPFPSPTAKSHPMNSSITSCPGRRMKVKKTDQKTSWTSAM